MLKIVLASRNRGKLAELKSLLKDLPVNLIPLDSYSQPPTPEETGVSFKENAIIKAKAVAQFTGEIALADDSGLEVEALGRKPGIFSSRYAGPQSSDEDNNRKLLAELKNVPREKRGASFVCALALVTTQGSQIVVEGRCWGEIGFQPKGSGGFGYDPLFICRQGKTLAELPPEIKNRISHRVQAARKLKRKLADLFCEGETSLRKTF